MKIAAISEIKAKLAKYLRLVKSGEEIEIHDRGVPVARLTAVRGSAISIAPSEKDRGRLAGYAFSVKPRTRFDVVATLLEDRARR